MTKQKVLLALILILCLLNVGCSQSEILTTLTLVVTSAEIAIPVIGAAAGIPPPVIALISTYLQSVAAFTSQASDILAGAGTSAEKAAKILEASTAIAKGCKCFPAGIRMAQREADVVQVLAIPANVLAVIVGVERAVVNFLVNFRPHPGLVGAAPPAIKLGKADKVALKKLKQRSDQIGMQAKGLATQ